MSQVFLEAADFFLRENVNLECPGKKCLQKEIIKVSKVFEKRAYLELSADQSLTSATAQVPIGEEPRAICCSVSLVEGARSFENILTGHIFCLLSRSSSEKKN